MKLSDMGSVEQKEAVLGTERIHRRSDDPTHLIQEGSIVISCISGFTSTTPVLLFQRDADGKD